MRAARALDAQGLLIEGRCALPEIRVVDAPDGPLQLAQRQAGQLPRIIAQIGRIIPPPLLRWGDFYAARCLRYAGNPYFDEIDTVAELLGTAGAYALNFSFELGCTTACRAPDAKTAMQLYRTLDWPFRLGRDVVVARHAPPAGPYVNITWPGYVGVLTALAPGRFAAAINQPPMAYSLGRFSLGLLCDWVVNRWRVRAATALPPAHLLRQAFEQCATYPDAKTMLTTTPVCIPVTYTLTGTTPDEGCVIERREHLDCVIHPGPVCVTNHWLNDKFAGRPRGRNSRLRLAAMQAALPSLGRETFDWLTPPVLVGLTRMAAELQCRHRPFGCSQGWHGQTPQTQVLTLDQGACQGRA